MRLRDLLITFDDALDWALDDPQSADEEPPFPPSLAAAEQP